MDSQRRVELRRILESQRQALIEEIQQRKRDLRAEKSKFPRSDEDGRGSGLESDGIVESVQNDTEVFLLQAKSDELHKVEDALRRLKRGEDRKCSECGEEISERRLQVLPFAIRCKDCEEARESELSRIAQQRRTYPFA